MEKQKTFDGKVLVLDKRTHKILVEDKAGKSQTKSFSLIAPTMTAEELVKWLKNMIRLHGLNMKVEDDTNLKDPASNN